MKQVDLRLAAIAVTALAMPHTTLAANARSWVSNAGADSNPCTLASPCKTFQRAVDNTSPGGEVDVLNPGEYGTISIARSITIDGGNLAHIQATAAPGGILVRAGTFDSVLIRNLSIGAQPGVSGISGISWSSGATLLLENVSVTGGDSGITATSGGRNPYLVARNVTIRQTGLEGLRLQGAGASLMKAMLDHLVVDVVSGGNGINATAAHAVLTNCSITHASVDGIQAAAASIVEIEDSALAFSGTALFANGTNTLLRIAGSSIHDNSVALAAGNGGQILSFGTNRILGNVSGEGPTGMIKTK